tara:strand:- start:504 stop:1058 length:555 start_codon:yes stop_codon:yes gene_type:complete
VFYTGIGNARRPYHKGKSRSKLWRNVVNKYGYEVIILADNLTWEQACDMEKYLIKYYGRRDLGTGTLVNMTDGGEGAKNVVVSAETRAKMSENTKGENNPNYGKKASAEQRSKQSASAKGRKPNNIRLTEDQVIDILIELRDNPYYGQGADLGRKYGVHQNTIRDIKTNKTWKHICRETLTVKE